MGRKKKWEEGKREKAQQQQTESLERKKEMVTKAEGESSTNFVACLCHQHPVGMTDVQMMSCRKGIGREGGAIGAREDSRQAEPRSERGTGERGREGEREQDCGNPSLPCSHAIIQFSQDVTQYRLESECFPKKSY